MQKPLRLSLLMAGVVSLVTGCQPEAPAPAAGDLPWTHESALSTQGSWSGNSSLFTEEQSHTATLLGSGEVLVAGGYDRAGTVVRGQLYNPYTNSWRPAGFMKTSRYGHTATLLASGKVLVAGGRHLSSAGPGLPDFAEVYDPATDTWSHTANSVGGRVGHSAVLLDSGKVLLTGGNYGSIHVTRDAKLYDPETNTWSIASYMNEKREGHTSTVLFSGKVLVTGGSWSGPGNSTELYDLLVLQRGWSADRRC